MPNHEPRRAARGVVPWYLYSGNRLKYPMVRSSLLRLYRAVRKQSDPVAAWKAVVENDTSYKRERGLGGFVRWRAGMK